MLLFPVWVYLAGAVLALLAGPLKAGRAVLSTISFLAPLSAVTTLVPFLFFSRPRVIGCFGNTLLFRIEPAASMAALCLSAFGAVLSLWLAAICRGPGLSRALALWLFALGSASAGIFAAGPPSTALFTALSLAAMLFLAGRVKG